MSDNEHVCSGDYKTCPRPATHVVRGRGTLKDYFYLCQKHADIVEVEQMVKGEWPMYNRPEPLTPSSSAAANTEEGRLSRALRILDAAAESVRPLSMGDDH